MTPPEWVDFCDRLNEIAPGCKARVWYQPTYARRDQMAQCMDQLSPASRELVDLRYVSGLSLRQLSARLRRTEGAVQVALSRLRKLLRDCVERRVQQRRAVRL